MVPGTTNLPKCEKEDVVLLKTQKRPGRAAATHRLSQWQFHASDADGMSSASLGALDGPMELKVFCGRRQGCMHIPMLEAALGLDFEADQFGNFVQCASQSLA